MAFKKFENTLSELTNKIGAYLPFNGNIDDVVVLEGIYDRENATRLLTEVSEGKHFITKHLATKADLQEIGVYTESYEYYLFDKPTSFTQPVLIPQ